MIRRILQFAGAEIHRVQVQNGKANLRRALPGYNLAARWGPWLVLVDLDSDFSCPPELTADWLPQPSPLMRLRVVVRAVEAWLLADIDRFSEFFGVARSRLPVAPEGLVDPKAKLIELTAKSRRRTIRQDMVPRAGSGRRVGPAYTSRLIEFALTPDRGWRPDIAATRCPSLSRCLARLESLLSA